MTLFHRLVCRQSPDGSRRTGPRAWTRPRFCATSEENRWNRDPLRGVETATLLPSLAEAVRSTPAKITVHVLVFVVVIVLMSALSIWLGLGPVVQSP